MEARRRGPLQRLVQGGKRHLAPKAAAQPADFRPAQRNNRGANKPAPQGEKIGTATQ